MSNVQSTETYDLNVNKIPIADIVADDEFNCRGRIAPIDVIDLHNDIKQHGLLQPVIVTPLKGTDQSQPKYRLIAGFRRLFACRTLGWTTIPAITKTDIDERTAITLNLNENIQRQNLNIVQEAQALSRLRNLGLTETETASQLNMSRGWVQIRYMLLSLPKEIYPDIVAGLITQTNIRELYTIQSREGKEATLLAARGVKEAKQRGVKNAKAISEEVEKKAKRTRQRTEIFQMQDFIRNNLGNNLATRALAWAAGEITTEDVVNDVKSECESRGNIFTSFDPNER